MKTETQENMLMALKNAEFLLRKMAINWKKWPEYKDSLKRAAEDLRDAISKAERETKP